MLEAVLKQLIKSAPQGPGVYIFKNSDQVITYIGKAKSLKKRLSQYLQQHHKDMRVDAILGSSNSVEYEETASEKEALLLEAKLVQMHQPACNILLKHGQPFLYLLITAGDLPELKLVRHKKQRGVYVGPFLEKGSARRAYDFLIKTFALYRCHKKIEQGCLYYHMGYCAGFCRLGSEASESIAQEAIKEAYKKRIALAARAVKEDRQQFINFLKKEIELANKQLHYEYSRQLHGYLKAFESIFDILSLAGSGAQHKNKFMRDIWIVDEAHKIIVLFSETHAVLTRKQLFYDLALDNSSESQELLFEYMTSYYRTTYPAGTILINRTIDHELLKEFLLSWHHLSYDLRIVMNPEEGHEAALMRIALLQAEKEWAKRALLPQLLQQMFGLARAPKSIDCFDISHKQGHFMVGSCVRFTDGEPDTSGFRKFYIESVSGIDDYAALREIVLRRYQDPQELPDLVLIDGGKGQLSAVRDFFPPGRCISIAKREERIFSDAYPEGKLLDQKSFVGHILMALRDYAHHFAISFHRAYERKQHNNK